MVRYISFSRMRIPPKPSHWPGGDVSMITAQQKPRVAQIGVIHSEAPHPTPKKNLITHLKNSTKKKKNKEKKIMDQLKMCDFKVRINEYTQTEIKCTCSAMACTQLPHCWNLELLSQLSSPCRQSYPLGRDCRDRGVLTFQGLFKNSSNIKISAISAYRQSPISAYRHIGKNAISARP